MQARAAGFKAGFQNATAKGRSEGEEGNGHCTKSRYKDVKGRVQLSTHLPHITRLIQNIVLKFSCHKCGKYRYSL